jgi:hypothetical protein
MGKLHILAAGLLCALALRRAGSLRRPGPGRSLELALIFLALAELLQLGPLYRLSNELLGTPAGGSMLKTALATGTAAGVAGVAEGARSRPGRLRWGWAAAAMAVAVSTAPLVVSPVRAVPPELAGTTEYFDAGWRSVVHWAPFLAFTCWAMGSALMVSLSAAKKAGRGALRTSLGLVAAACTMGYVYVATKSAVLAAWHLHGTDLRFWARFDQTSEPLVVSLACVLGALGAGWENVVGTRRAVRKRLVLWQLRPLWGTLKELAPAVELAYGRAGPEFRLRRRVMEIRDGLLAVEDRLGAELVDAAQAGAEALGAPGPLAVAAILRYLAEQGSRPEAPGTRRARLPTAAAGTFDEELEWLKEVGRWYRDPKAKTLSARLAAGSV